MNIAKYKKIKEFKSILKANNLTVKNRLLKYQPTFTVSKKQIVVTLSILSILTTNLVTAYLNNQNPPVNNNFSPDRVIEDNNNNDINFDDSGQIIVNPISPNEMETIVNKFNSELLVDIKNRVSEPITKIDEILSIYQLPYNSFEGDNEFDKYQLSIIFTANDKNYCINYLTGQQFKYDEVNKKDMLLNFVNFLSNSSLDLCSSMGEIEKQILDLLGDDYLFVSPSYYAYGQSGDLYYYIPVFGCLEGKPFVKLFSCMANLIDAYDLNPSTVLLSQLKGDKDIFNISDVKNEEDYYNILNLYSEFSLQSSNAKSNNNYTNYEKKTIDLSRSF